MTHDYSYGLYTVYKGGFYEIETYIKKNHHLPKIPSAQEIKENGLSLKEMNLLLLEKIEELMLFTIQQQKEIDLLKEKTAVCNRQ